MPKNEFRIPGPKETLGGDALGPIEHLTIPEKALVVGIAEGDVGDKVGVFGSTEVGTGVWGRAEKPEGTAGMFEGTVEIVGALRAKGNHFFDGTLECTGDVSLKNADCAEDFSVSGMLNVEPGTVMVLDDEGTVSESRKDYDRCVAGVVSGAGNYKPALVLDKQDGAGNRQPIALMGKVYCKVDANFGSIEIGDLLTTSRTPGHAMKTNDPAKAFGAVIGKALRPLKEGRGLIPILVALQ